MSAKGQALRSLCVVSGIALGVLFFNFLAMCFKGINVADMGLGRNTGGRDAVFENRLLNCTEVNCLKELAASFAHFESEKNEIVLWFGNSQLHAINLIKPTDRLAVDFLNQKAQAAHLPIRYLQISIPHANFHEHLANYLKIRSLGVKPKYLLIAAVYYDLHSRKLMLRNLTLPKAEEKRIGRTGVVQLSELIEERNREEQKALQLGAHLQEEETPQSRVEKKILSWLERHWEAYSLRSVLLAQPEFMANELFSKFVRSAFKRRSPDIPKERREWNLEALYSLVRIAKADGVRVMIYRPPIRPNYETYLNVSDYQDFFVKLKAFAQLEKVELFDLENLVPEEFWGFANGGLPDYFHFQEKGHELLADAVHEQMIHSTRSRTGRGIRNAL